MVDPDGSGQILSSGIADGMSQIALCKAHENSKMHRRFHEYIVNFGVFAENKYRGQPHN